jgi:hypothetical protein
LITVITGALVAVATLAMLGMFAILFARRRRRRDMRLELLPEEARQPPAALEAGKPEARRSRTSWERDWALDEAPIGSVEYRPPPTPPDDGS